MSDPALHVPINAWQLPMRNDAVADSLTLTKSYQDIKFGSSGNTVIEFKKEKKKTN